MELYAETKGGEAAERNDGVTVARARWYGSTSPARNPDGASLDQGRTAGAGHTPVPIPDRDERLGRFFHGIWLQG
jgi:hypothetical protein